MMKLVLIENLRLNKVHLLKNVTNCPYEANSSHGITYDTYLNMSEIKLLLWWN